MLAPAPIIARAGRQVEVAQGAARVSGDQVNGFFKPALIVGAGPWRRR